MDAEFATKLGATAAGKALIGKLRGDGWKLVVHENIGWHYKAVKGPIKVYPVMFSDGYACLCGPGEDGGLAAYSPVHQTFADPNEAVSRAIEITRAAVAAEVAFLAGLEAAFGVGPRPDPPDGDEAPGDEAARWKREARKADLAYLRLEEMLDAADRVIHDHLDKVGRGHRKPACVAFDGLAALEGELNRLRLFECGVDPGPRVEGAHLPDPPPAGGLYGLINGDDDRGAVTIPVEDNDGR